MRLLVLFRCLCSDWVLYAHFGHLHVRVVHHHPVLHIGLPAERTTEHLAVDGHQYSRTTRCTRYLTQQ